MSDFEASYGGQPVHDPLEGRRQCDDLLPADLQTTPAWWFPGADGRLSGPDAGTVLPVDTADAAQDGAVEFPDGRFLLHAVFTLADGRRIDGHVTYSRQDDGSLAAREPTLCTDRGQVPLWHGILHPTDGERASFLAAVGEDPSGVFPLRWRTTLHPAEEDVTGQAHGFAVLVEGDLRWV